MWTKDIEKNIRDRRVSGVVMQFEEEPLHNHPEDLEKAKALLQETLGSEWVTDDLNILIGYSRDQSPFPAQYTHLVCLPSTTEEVSQIYKIANECKVDVMPMGTGLTTMAIHIPLYGGIIMDLRRMDQVLETDGANNFMRIQPGINYLHAQVDAQKVGCRVLNPSTAATAAVISNHGFCNINTLASKYGFGMDNVIETTMVMPDGTIMKTGPRRLRRGQGPDARPGARRQLLLPLRLRHPGHGHRDDPAHLPGAGIHLLHLPRLRARPAG